MSYSISFTITADAEGNKSLQLQDPLYLTEAPVGTYTVSGHHVPADQAGAPSYGCSTPDGSVSGGHSQVAPAAPVVSLAPEPVGTPDPPAGVGG